MDNIENKTPAAQQGEPVSRFLDEGNPNTDKVIEKTQHEPSVDVKLVAATKEAINRETSISQESHNVQVTADNGIVTLIGVVLSSQEKMTIGDKATAVAGFGNVNNQLQVAEVK